MSQKAEHATEIIACPSLKPRDKWIDVAVVVPTYNERGNVPELIERLQRVLRGFEWELIFVDDNSPDGTAELIREIAAKDRQIRLLHRIGRRGLASACIEGMLATPAESIAVMDGDLQHDESILPAMVALATSRIAQTSRQTIVQTNRLLFSRRLAAFPSSAEKISWTDGQGFRRGRGRERRLM